MGPWTHILPDLYPFEPWDYLHEMKRWWDYWLKGEQNEVLDEPSGDHIRAGQEHLEA